MSHASSQTIDFLTTRDRGGPAMRRLALGLISATIAAIRSERARRRNTRILTQLDDRLLRDIGICRSDIDRVIRCGW